MLNKNNFFLSAEGFLYLLMQSNTEYEKFWKSGDYSSYKPRVLYVCMCIIINFQRMRHMPFTFHIGNHSCQISERYLRDIIDNKREHVFSTCEKFIDFFRNIFTKVKFNF